MFLVLEILYGGQTPLPSFLVDGSFRYPPFPFSFSFSLFTSLTRIHSLYCLPKQPNDVNLVSGTQTEHFFGWMDELAFYNRVLSVEEISKNWQKAIDTTDASLFLYYNFDEGPSAAVIQNHGTIGSQADLYNGQVGLHFHTLYSTWLINLTHHPIADQVLGSTTYLETTSQTLLTVQPGIFSPGAPVMNASPVLPVVFAVDTGSSARLSVACQLTTTTTTASSLIPSLAQIVTLPSGTGKIYQTDIGQTRITAPTALTSPVAEFWYYASATTTTGSPVVDSMQYSCVCNGVTQTGTINVIINPSVVPDQTISLAVVSGTNANINLHGSIVNPGLMTVNITSLPKLGRLSQWDFEQPDLITPISRV